VIDIVEILVHWHAGRPIAVVVESLGTDRKTIRKYVAPAVSGPVGGPGWGLVPSAERPPGPQPDPCGDRRPQGTHCRDAEVEQTHHGAPAPA
jgi:hypothetical protein